MSDATAVKNEMLDIAVTAHGAGLCVLPPKQDGSKRPMKAWEQYANTSSTLEEVQTWYGDGHRTGLGLVLGAASGGVECFEFDDMDAFNAYLDRMDELGHTDLYRKVESGYSERTPNGVHWFYQCDEVAGNTKLARRPKTESEKSSEHDNVKVLIETRGQGGYAIVAPSHGSVHPTGAPYTRLEGGLDSITKITPQEREIMWSVARSFDEMSDAPAVKKEAERVTQPVLPSPQRTESQRPGDWFNETKSWAEVLEPAGWTHVFDRGEESYWRRPGKDRDHSGTTNYEGTDVMKVFSSSTPFDPEKSYTKFAAYAVLHHNGDYKAAARAVFPDMPKESRLLGVVPDRHDLGAPSDHVPSDEDGEGSTGTAPRAGDSWKRVDLSPYLTGEVQSIVPTMLSREDDINLLYPGRIHEFKGHPEAGKGWFALLACRQELRKGNNVAYIDFEDYPDGIIERLLAMGVSRDRIDAQFMYYNPEETFDEAASKNLFDEIKEMKPVLCIIDSVAEVMAANALDPLSNSDAATFVTMMPRPIANLGATVVLIDHITKSAENVRFSVGAQHKLAAVSGSSFVIENEQPLGVGMKGMSRVTVAKDRPGRVRKNAEGGKVIGRMVVHSNDDGTLTDVQLVKPLSMTIEGMEVSAELMGDVAGFIESQGKRAPSGNEVRAACTGRNEAIDLALERLTAGGFLFRDSRKGRGGGYCYTSLRPYRA